MRRSTSCQPPPACTAPGTGSGGEKAIGATKKALVSSSPSPCSRAYLPQSVVRAATEEACPREPPPFSPHFQPRCCPQEPAVLDQPVEGSELGPTLPRLRSVVAPPPSPCPGHPTRVGRAMNERRTRGYPGAARVLQLHRGAGVPKRNDLRNPLLTGTATDSPASPGNRSGRVLAHPTFRSMTNWRGGELPRLDVGALGERPLAPTSGGSHGRETRSRCRGLGRHPEEPRRARVSQKRWGRST